MAEPRVSLIPGISDFWPTRLRHSNAFRKFLEATGSSPSSLASNRKRKMRHDQQAYKNRNVIECCFCGLKDFRRITTRYDSLARNFFSAICFVHPCVLAPI